MSDAPNSQLAVPDAETIRTALRETFDPLNEDNRRWQDQWMGVVLCALVGSMPLVFAVLWWGFAFQWWSALLWALFSPLAAFFFIAIQLTIRDDERLKRAAVARFDERFPPGSPGRSVAMAILSEEDWQAYTQQRRYAERLLVEQLPTLYPEEWYTRPKHPSPGEAVQATPNLPAPQAAPAHAQPYDYIPL